MNTRTSIAIFAATALATRLLGGSLSIPEPVDVRDGSAARSVAASKTPPVSFVNSERLRERLKVPLGPERGRNPFTYGARHAAPDTPRAAEVPPPVAAPKPTEPPPPPIRLTGIASDLKDGARILTGILNEYGAIVFVKDGDRLSSGYTVVKVDEMSVTLADANGVTMTLRLP